MEVNIVPSQRSTEICSESLKGRILRMIYFPVKDSRIWRTRYNIELYRLCDELEVVKVIKIGILRWLIHLFRMQELFLTESLFFLNQKTLVQENLS